MTCTLCSPCLDAGERRLTTQQVRAVRRLIADGDSDAKIADDLNIGRWTIGRIRWGLTYKNVV